MTRSDRWRKRPCVLSYWSWKDRARDSYASLGCIEESRITSVNWVACFAPPRSWSKKKKEAHIGQYHRSKPDKDNIDKALLDALFDRDELIPSGCHIKIWGERHFLLVEIEYE